MDMNDFQVAGTIIPNENDVLSGRGTSINSHPGNKQFRDYVNVQRALYAKTHKNEKHIFAYLLVNTIRNLVPPGRFLEQDKETKLWHDTGDQKAWNKTRQALREPKIKNSTSPHMRDYTKNINDPTSNDLPASTKSESSTVQLRLMLVRQLEVAAFNQSGDQWLSENVVSEEDTKKLPISPQNVTENSDSFIRDEHGRAFPLRQSFTQGDRRGSGMKRDPKYALNESMGTFSTTGLSGISDPTNISNFTGISFATESTGTASCSSGPVKVNITEPPKKAHDVDTNAFNNSLFLEGIAPLSLGEKEGLDSTNVNNIQYGFTELMMKEDLSIASSAFTSEKRPSSLKTKQLSGLSGISGTMSKEDLSIASSAFLPEKRLLSLKNSTADLSTADSTLMSERRQSLLRASFSTYVPDIGEGNEDDLTYEDSHASKTISMNSIQTDEIMSTRSRRRSSLLSRGNLVHSCLDDLSNLSGRMSICENMSMADSGVLSMSVAEVEDWVGDAARWERDAEIEDCQVTQEELMQLKQNSEEVDNMIEMSSMMSDVFFVNEYKEGSSTP